MANNDSTSNKITDYYYGIDEQLKAAIAICDAVAILTALERSPSHHDTDPSHNIMTGEGYAHGLKVSNETLPAMLKHAANLISMSHNDVDCIFSHAIDAIDAYRLKEINHAKD